VLKAVGGIIIIFLEAIELIGAFQGIVVRDDVVSESCGG
jgi:hypothetical protein